MTDIDQMMRRSRPLPERGWAGSADGQRVLDDVLNSTPEQRPVVVRRRWLRPVLVGTGGLAVLAGAGAAAAVLLAPEPPPAWQVPGSSVACASERSKDADLAIYRWKPGTDPVNMCREHWIGTTGTAPDRLYSCVLRKASGDGGGLIVIPGDGYGNAAEACATIGMYVAPADLKPAPLDTNTPRPPTDVPGTQPTATTPTPVPTATATAVGR